MENREAIISELVKENERISFLPDLCKGTLEGMKFESLVFAWMKRLSPQYIGGYWNFYKLSNGGGYMALFHQHPITIESTNGFSFVLSPDAAGIVISLFAMCHASQLFQGEAGKHFAEQYHNLLDYVDFHPEATKIYGAID